MITILQSLAVYLSTALMLFALGRLASRREANYKKYGKNLTFWTWEINASLLLFAIVSGIRWNVGVDHLSYLDYYHTAELHGTPVIEFEPAFNSFTKFMASSGFHYSIYFGVLAFLQLFFVYWSFKNERYLLPFIGLTVILDVHYLSWMNGIRQMLVATIFLYSIQFIVKRKIFHYIAIIVAVSLVHKSSLWLLPLVFLPINDYLPKRLFVLVALIISFYFGLDSAWIELLETYLVGSLILIDYQSYAENIIFLVTQSEAKNLGPRRLIEICLFCTVVLYSPFLKKRFADTKFLIYYNYYVIGFIAYNLLVNTNHIFLRPIYYLTLCGLPVAAYLLVYLSEQSKKYLLPFVFSLALACAYTPLSVVADSGLGDRDYSNYKTFLFHDLQ